MAAVTALVLASCSSMEGLQKSNASSAGVVRVAVMQPENLLIPGDTTEMSGHQILDSLFTGLIQYNPMTSNAEFSGVASKIVTADNTTFTIELRQDWTFHDGTTVNADSFIDAWNYTALSTNRQKAAYFMSSIQGYDDLQATDGQTPRYQEMSGLRKINEFSFSVTLKSPFAQWPLMTGYSAFYPLPKAFYSNPKDFGRKPIGNGPWKVSKEFVEAQGMTLVGYDSYAGVDRPRASELEFVVFSDLDTAYKEVMGGGIDVARVPNDAVRTAKQDFGRRYTERDSSVLTYIGFPLYLERYADKRVRQAFSMAVDRQSLCDTIFNGTRTPAASIVAPQIPGARRDACPHCKYDPQKAKELLDSTDFDTSKPVELWFNSGSDHDKWLRIVGNQWEKNLGVKYELRGSLQFKEFLPKVEKHQLTGPFRMGWGMDYPSAQNYLEPLFSTVSLKAGGANSTYYSNPQFDELVRRGNTAMTGEQAVKHYQEAEDVLLEDLPVVPLFFGLSQYVHSERVDDLVINGFSGVETTRLKVVQ